MGTLLLSGMWCVRYGWEFDRCTAVCGLSCCQGNGYKCERYSLECETHAEARGLIVVVSSVSVRGLIYYTGTQHTMAQHNVIILPWERNESSQKLPHCTVHYSSCAQYSA